MLEQPRALDAVRADFRRTDARTLDGRQILGLEQSLMSLAERDRRALLPARAECAACDAPDRAA